MTTNPRGCATPSQILRHCQMAAVACTAWAGIPALAAGLLDREVTLDIPAQPLPQALAQLGSQAHIQIRLAGNVGDQESQELKGTIPAGAALSTLLRGSGLSFQVRDDAITVASAAALEMSRQQLGRALGADAQGGAASGSQASQAGQTTVPESSSQQGQAAPGTGGKVVMLPDVVVTGTHIRGEQPVGATVNVYTRTDMDEAGATTLDQFARQMTENFSDVDTTSNPLSNSTYARFGGGSGENTFEGGAFDLHGLGASSTLTLLNGQRLALGGEDGSFVDTSMIPLAAVDHIEVLADGASAIYGADAVAGVVNIVTREHYEGAETSVRYGQSTDGGASDVTASQLIGQAWAAGDAILAYEYDNQGELDASQRGYIGDQGGPYSLIPSNRKNSVFLSANQQLGDALTLSAVALYSERDFGTEYSLVIPGSSLLNPASGSATEPVVTITLGWVPYASWDVNLSGNYSRLRQVQHQVEQDMGMGFEESYVVNDSTESSTLGGDLLVSGPVVGLPAGDIKLALGTSYRSESFQSQYNLSATGALAETRSDQIATVTRDVTSAYGELVVPAFEHENAMPAIQRLELSAAIRMDHYSDFGSSTNPKFGLLWEPVSSVSLKGTLGRSFRAPPLSDIHSAVGAAAEVIPDSQSPSGESDVLFLSGGNPDLGPEKSRSYTVGLDVKPTAVPGLKLTSTYFDVVYRDRILTPPVSGGDYLNDPTLSPFVTRDPPQSLVEYYFNQPSFGVDESGLGPEGVTAIFDDRLANIATTRESGVDVGGSYEISSRYGRFGFSADAQRLMHYELQAVPGGSSIELLNTYGEPTEWKARANLAWHLGGLGAGVTAHYVNSYDNSLFSPPTRIGSWTTADLYLSYSTRSLPGAPILRDITVLLTVQNVADRAPPYAPLPPIDLLPGQNPLPFDPANASPLGRVVSLEITKNWW